MFVFHFLLVYFWFLSNNTLHVMLYTYICYWNTFQYKYIIQITFHVIKQSHVTSKDICLLFMIYLLFAYFCFISASFYFMKLSSSLIFNWPYLRKSHLRLFSPQSVILIPIDVCKTNSSQKVYTNLILTIWWLSFSIFFLKRWQSLSIPNFCWYRIPDQSIE